MVQWRGDLQIDGERSYPQNCYRELPRVVYSRML